MATLLERLAGVQRQVHIDDRGAVISYSIPLDILRAYDTDIDAICRDVERVRTELDRQEDS